MKPRFYLAAIATLITNFAFAQKKVWDIPTLEAQISRNSGEFSRQTDLRNNQTLSTATQTAARSQGAAIKDKIKVIHSRLISLSSLLSDGKMLIDSYSIVKDILKYQEKIVSAVANDPQFLPLVLVSEKMTVERANVLINYIELIALSASDLNAMTATDRRSIINYAITQLRVIRGDSYGLSAKLDWAQRGSVLNYYNPWNGYVSKDKQLANNILKDLKF
jgi:hypothetical protein